MRVGRKWWLFGLTATLLAAEKPPTEPSKARAEDGIAASRRDLELIRAAKGGAAEQPRDGSPQFPGSEIQFTPTEQPRPPHPLTPTQAAAAKKSTNWLIEAVMKKPAGATEEKERSENISRLENAEIRFENATRNRNKDQSAVARADRQEARQIAEQIVNPLTNFMAGWMTPHDYKLLQSGMGAESAVNLVARGERAANAVFPSSGSEPAVLSALGKPASNPLAQVPRENPFLQDIGATAAAASKPFGSIPQPAIETQTTAKPSIPTPEPPPARPIAPGFVKPNDDAKYFKPLKRF